MGLATEPFRKTDGPADSKGPLKNNNNFTELAPRFASESVATVEQTGGIAPLFRGSANWGVTEDGVKMGCQSVKLLISGGA